MNVTELRERLMLTQAEFAERVAVSPRTVQNWEAGTRPQYRHLRKLVALAATTDLLDGGVSDSGWTEASL